MEAYAYKFLNLKPNSDGSLTRLNQPPTRPAIPEIDPTKPDSEPIALCKDIPLNPTHKTFIRLYRPRSPPQATKIPLIIYFHGGGFIIFSATSVIYHEPCNRMAAHSPAIIASVEYRLAPEHRLPAAYDDAVDAINWVKSQATATASTADPWVKEFADLSRVFLMGCSAGANIVYHAALRAADLDLHPVKIVGLIMNQPFFGGPRRTESEVKHLEDKVLPPHVTDLMWSLALPEGADRGHVYCNLQAGENHVGENIGRLPPSLVREVAGDTLLDWQKEFVKMLELRGVRVVAQLVDGGHHAVEIVDPDPKFAQAFYDDVRDFICSIGVVSSKF